MEMQRNNHDIVVGVLLLLVCMNFWVRLFEENHFIGECIHFLKLLEIEDDGSRGGHAGNVMPLKLAVLPVDHYNLVFISTTTSNLW